jgi:GNAT superfamily N-acetyltransferase
VSIAITRPTAAHRAAWEGLYAGYAAFYKVEQDAAMRATVWGWIHDPAQEVDAFLALDAAGAPVGLAHFRPFARPLRAALGLYLDDLFVDPAARGQRIADALIEAVAEEGRRRGATLLRWITADDNYRGRSVYDRLATRTPWITYDKAL